MAMLKLRDGRELEVAEKVAEILAADETGKVCDAVKVIPGTTEAKTKLTAAGSKLVVLHEIRTTVKRKFPTPVDTKAEFEHQVIEHIVNLDHVMDVQPTVAEIELAPVHDRKQAKMPAVSGPFKHDYERHAFKFGEWVLEEGRVVDDPTAQRHAPGTSNGQQQDNCNTVTTEGYPKQH